MLSDCPSETAIALQRVRPEDKVEQAYVDKRERQYLCSEGSDFICMDEETYDQVPLGADWIGDQILYLRENDKAKVVFYEGKPISLELPEKVELRVAETDPSARGDR